MALPIVPGTGPFDHDVAHDVIDSLHMQLRKVVKARGHFPSDKAAHKLIRLALRNVIAKWTASRQDWKSAMMQIALLHPERFSLGIRVFNPPHTKSGYLH